MNRKLGNKELPAIGLGCMGMSEFYGESDDNASIETLVSSFDLGYRHYDTADMYGYGKNEELLGKFLRKLNQPRDEIFISSKVGIVRDENNKYDVALDGSAEYIRKSCEASLRRLGTDYLDLYYLHRIAPNVELEESLETLKELKIEGKIRAIGLCEVAPETLRKANSIHKISAVQSEYSLWSRDVETEVIPTCEELDVAFIAFSPLGRGFLSGKIDKSFMNQADSDLDFRKRIPRFTGENFEKNLALVEQFKSISESLGVAPSELALNWILNKSENIHIIPGTRKIKYLTSNFNAKDLNISTEVYQKLDALFSSDAVHGERYPVKILETTE